MSLDHVHVWYYNECPLSLAEMIIIYILGAGHTTDIKTELSNLFLIRPVFHVHWKVSLMVKKIPVHEVGMELFLLHELQ